MVIRFPHNVEVTPQCPCAETGKDGTVNNNESSGSLYSQGKDSIGKLWLVVPCKNHLGNYKTGLSFKRLR